jgi:hypothetical protein
LHAGELLQLLSHVCWSPDLVWDRRMPVGPRHGCLNYSARRGL